MCSLMDITEDKVKAIVKEEPVVEKPVVEKEVVEKPKKSNKWVDEVKALSVKKNISYKEAMKEASLIRRQAKDTKS